jgi:dihydrofolate reductase
MRRITLIVHFSLDGFVAGPKGNLGYFTQSDENLQYVNSLLNNADSALLGRNSYELLASFWSDRCNVPEATSAEIEYSNWFNAAQKIVVSAKIKENVAGNVMFIHKNIENEILKIKQSAGKDILIFGSPQLSKTLMESDLIDDFQVFIHPVFFGKGLQLFTSLSNKVELELTKLNTLSIGHVLIHYIKK